jgi:DNA-binding NarL/FixJ family response regulator
MRIAKVRDGTPPPQRPVATVVVGGDAVARHAVARLLPDDGFAVDPASRPESPALIIVLLSIATEAERVGQLRAQVERHPDARLLAIMPVGATNTSLRRVLIAGATGIALDDDLERTLEPTAWATLAGLLALPMSLARHIAPRPLSHREKEILSLVMLGRTNREIAHALFLAESTVKTHLSSAFRKLDARSRSEAVTRLTDPEGGYAPAILEIPNATLAAAG